jgi:hypothetical protein
MSFHESSTAWEEVSVLPAFCAAINDVSREAMKAVRAKRFFMA